VAAAIHAYFRALSEVNDNLGQAAATNTDPKRFWNAFFYSGSPGAPQRTASGYNPNSGPPEPVYQRSWSEYWSEVGQVLYGEAKSVYDTGAGVATLLTTNPVTTVSNLSSAIYNYDQTWNAIVNTIKEKSQTYQGQGEIAGSILQIVFPIAAARVNGVSAFGAATRGSQLADRLGDAGNVVASLTAASRKAVMLGEGMEAVKTAARQMKTLGINVKWYQAWGRNFPAGRAMTSLELAAALARNEKWIRSKIAQGYKLYDIGIDPTRATRSPFYRLEQRIINELGASTTPVPRP
jgi:hypothetical protein